MTAHVIAEQIKVNVVDVVGHDVLDGDFRSFPQNEDELLGTFIVSVVYVLKRRCEVGGEVFSAKRWNFYADAVVTHSFMCYMNQRSIQ